MKQGEYWENRIARKVWKAYNTAEDRNRDLIEFYMDASRQIREELYSIAEKYSRGGVMSLSDMHKENRLKNLEKKYRGIAKELGEKVEATATQTMQEGYAEVYQVTGEALGIGFDTPNKKLMEKALNEPWGGGEFSSRLWKNQKNLVGSLNDVLLRGMQQGKAVTEIAVDLHNRVGNSFNACHRLVRTETMHYLNDATLRRYKDAGVTQVQVWAAIDERTCDVCGIGGYHERIYPIEKAPSPPFHPNCRCTILPFLSALDDAAEEADVKFGIEEWISGLHTQKKRFLKKLDKVKNDDAKILLRQSFDRVKIFRSPGGKTFYSPSKKAVYLSDGHNENVLAHELFHEIDNAYGLTSNGFLKTSLGEDYELLKKRATDSGKPMEEMLYSEYPKLFLKRNGIIEVREEGHGISDIIDGMTRKKVSLGYGHRLEYWNRNLALQKEACAQFGEMEYRADGSVVQVAKEIFPHSYQEFQERIRRMMK